MSGFVCCCYYYYTSTTTSATLGPLFRSIAYSISFLQTYPFLAASCQFRSCSKSTASLQTAFSHLQLGFPTGLLPPKHNSITLYGYEDHPTSLCDKPIVVLTSVKSWNIFGHFTIFSVGEGEKGTVLQRIMGHSLYQFTCPVNTMLVTSTSRTYVEFTHQQMHFFYFKKHIKIYIKIRINIAPTCFGLRTSSGSLH